MTSSEALAPRWFGAAFSSLHPLLQDLHRRGGRLEGPVEITVADGLAGWLGRRLAARLGVPAPGPANRLAVDIHSDERVLHWDRMFNGTHRFPSEFEPVGHYPDGHWLEHIGPLRVALRVEIVDGGWHWRPGAARWGSIRLPAWLLPKSTAYKCIVGDRYRFHVGFAFPGVGTVLSYGGDLSLSRRAGAG